MTCCSLDVDALVGRERLAWVSDSLVNHVTVNHKKPGPCSVTSWREFPSHSHSHSYYVASITNKKRKLTNVTPKRPDGFPPSMAFPKSPSLLHSDSLFLFEVQPRRLNRKRSPCSAPVKNKILEKKLCHARTVKSSKTWTLRHSPSRRSLRSERQSDTATWIVQSLHKR